MRKICLLFIGGILLLSGCGDNPQTDRECAEEYGAVLLQQARNAFQDADFMHAIVLIDSIRATYPLAMEAREQGILLKDSVLLEEARTELNKAVEANAGTEQIEELQMKVKFYIKKLQHDIEQRQSHK